MIIASVLRTGGDFDAGAYVRHLRAGVGRHLPLPHRFVVLTDADWFPGEDPAGWNPPEDVRWVVSLRHPWPRWWPKLELLRPGLFPAGELILYLDLDTALVGDLSPFAAYDGEFAVLRDLLRPDRMIGSGMLLWRPGSPAARRIWETFTRDPAGVMSRNRTRMDYFLHPLLRDADRIQDLWPGTVKSYKAHCRERRRGGRVRIPPGTRVVCFHGRPRPHETDPEDPVRREWER